MYLSGIPCASEIRNEGNTYNSGSRTKYQYQYQYQEYYIECLGIVIHRHAVPVVSRFEVSPVTCPGLGATD